MAPLKLNGSQVVLFDLLRILRKPIQIERQVVMAIGVLRIKAERDPKHLGGATVLMVCVGEGTTDLV
jgi:hypothetical protein